MGLLSFPKITGRHGLGMQEHSIEVHRGYGLPFDGAHIITFTITVADTVERTQFDEKMINKQSLLVNRVYLLDNKIGINLK